MTKGSYTLKNARTANQMMHTVQLLQLILTILLQRLVHQKGGAAQTQSANKRTQ